MKGHKQERNECMLATIASLADVSLDEVRAFVKPYIHPCRNWEDLTDWGSCYGEACAVWWRAVAAAAEHYNIPVCLLVRSDVVDKYGLPRDQHKVYEVGQTLPAVGRGTIQISLSASIETAMKAMNNPQDALDLAAGRALHILPFENGLVYDPNNPYCFGLPLEANLDVYRSDGTEVTINSIKVIREDV